MLTSISHIISRKKLLTLLAAIALAMPGIYAQGNAKKGAVHRQRGVVRMITNSPNDPITAVKGARVIIDGEATEPTDANGVFVKEVTSDFKVEAVRPADKYIIAIPCKGKIYKRSNNDIDVVVTTKERRDKDYKLLYDRLLDKYGAQQDSVIRLMRQLERTRRELDQTSQEYARVTARLDNVRALNLQYINNADRIEEEISKIADELAVTDYQSLTDTEKRVYRLKCAGDWEAVSRLINEVMHGDAAKFLLEGKLLKEQKEEELRQKETELRQAKLALESRLHLMESAIESFKIRHLNDSASIYYAILTDAAPDDCEYLIAAGTFERDYMADNKKSLDYLNRAIAANPDKSQLATCYDKIGWVYKNQGEYDNALEMLSKALDIRLETFGDDNPEAARSYTNMSWIYKIKGDYERALETAQKAIKVQEASISECKPALAGSYNNLGAIYDDLGRYDEALVMHHKALDLILEVFGESDPTEAASYNNIGLIYEKTGDYDKAFEMLGKALEIWLEAYGETHPDVAMCYSNIGIVYFDLGDFGNALDMHRKALDIRLATLGDSHPDIALCYNNIGLVYGNQGDADTALEMHRKALDIRLATLGDRHPEVATSLSNIALAYLIRGELDKALESYRKTLDIRLSLFGEVNPDVASSYFAIGYVYLCQGDDLRSAYEMVEKSYNIFKMMYGEDATNTKLCKDTLSQIAAQIDGGAE